ncbi:hypothetical protein C8N24_0144 [Solirubrobacter pauli]|uniref:Uncharacterized protein n=1 Tax=Solirubrobacter pauli TaxID=166793 RepID=A0A660L8W2_9ACTN|nr:hypothetical protein [Solirubrobacter pauli]RKQ90343.1 hypothetical protein C8N24_0144 [Solirubrobacter pauli]
MSLAVVISTAVLAHGCAALPAPSAKYVPVSVVKVDEHAKRTALRVCVGGRRVELARGSFDEERGGVRVGAASAAGNRVAWIEEHARGRTRAAVVTLAAVGREVRVLRRFTAYRTRTRAGLQTDVLLTRAGDLAWSAGTYSGPGGVVAVKQPGRRTRRLARSEGGRLALEDGRTLRWDDGDFLYAFSDLRPIDCRRRSRYATWARNDRAIVTHAHYFESSVVRGCDPATGRDRVILQNYSSLGSSSLLFLDLLGEWAVFHQAENWKDGPGPATLTVVNARTGRSLTGLTYDGENRPHYPIPLNGAPIAVTRRGVLAYARDNVLWALVARDRFVRLDEGAIADLHADGDAFTWTRDGVPRRFMVGG